jgi:hypothetical protein
MPLGAQCTVALEVQRRAGPAAILYDLGPRRVAALLGRLPGRLVVVLGVGALGVLGALRGVLGVGRGTLLGALEEASAQRLSERARQPTLSNL